jgi:predicted deacylase
MAQPPIQQIEIGGALCRPGETCNMNIPVAAMYTKDDVSLNVQVVRGRKPGPAMFISAAIHGDEIGGVEIIRRLLQHKSLKRLKGTLLAIPIVNVHGFINHSRYLPDGRDLNRSFPGTAHGSLAGRLAHTFMEEIVSKCTHGIDLHTGARHRSNFPQIRADLTQPGVKEMTEAFGVPLVLNSKLRDGSLREAAGDLGIPVILYEAGEALRFEEVYIRAGVTGIINVMRGIGMLPASRSKRQKPAIQICDRTVWVRAPESGILRTLVPPGARVEEDQPLGMIADPVGNSESAVLSPCPGVVIGRTNLPLAYAGDALFHIARYGIHDTLVEQQVEEFQEEHEGAILPAGEDDASNAPIA